MLLIIKMIEQIIDKYRRDGFISLSQAASTRTKNKLYYELWDKYLTHNSITTSELKSMTSNKREIYYQEKPEGNIEYTDVDVTVLTERTNRNILEKQSGHSPKERYACELPDCVFFSGLAVPFYKNSCVLEPFGGEIDDFLSTKRITDRKEFFDNRIGLRDVVSEKYFNSGRENKSGTGSEVIFPLVHWYKSYYHWIADYLPKLRILDKYEKETGDEPKILIRKDSASYRTQSLELLGYSEDRIIEWSNDDRIISRAVFTNHRRGQAEHSRQDYRWLRNQVIDKIEMQEHSSEYDYIYISRQGEKDGENVHNDRSVNEFEKFSELIKSYGFKIVRAEEYSFEEQIQLFNSAKVIMGPHGGGLTNMIFANDPLIIELFPDSKVIPLYSYLSDALKFDYQAVVVESNGDNLVIDMDEFENFLSNTFRSN